MAAIKESTLQHISGATGLGLSQSLLDNTLATVRNKIAQREHQQLSQLRSMQIQQTGDEMLEYQKQAHLRDLTNQLAEKEKKSALENYDYNADVQAQLTENQLAESNTTAQFAIYDQILSAPDAASRDKILGQYSHMIPQELVDKVSNAEPGTAAWTKVQRELMIDRDYLQKLDLERVKASGKSGGGPPKNRASVASISSSLEGRPGIGGKAVTDGIAETAIGISDTIQNQTGQAKPAILIAKELADMVYQEPERYMPDNPDDFFGGGERPALQRLYNDYLYGRAPQTTTRVFDPETGTFK